VCEVGTADDSGLPLGICPGVEYPSATLELPPGSRVLLYTDGLADAFCPEGAGHRAFGMKGIAETLRRCQDDGPQAVLERLLGESRAFTGGSGRHDDTSVVVLERCLGEPEFAPGQAASVDSVLVGSV
jgi:serine phosphatase RsbU (regulator of sigma subunit)